MNRLLLFILLLAVGMFWPTAALHAEKPFPTKGLLPKEEIGALRFLEQHPEYDGRGAVVAIFDTGVDPGAAGLQTTSDGKPKVIDMIDGTGSGDVDTSTVMTPKDGQIEGLTGRMLKLDPKWLAKDRKFHIGIKRGYDLYPGRLVGRLKKERRRKFEIQQRKTEEALRRELATAKGKQRSELQSRLTQLQTIYKKYDDPGPIYDCLVFHDGKTWQAVVDTDTDGDLTDEQLLTNFRDSLQYGTFHNDQAALNFAVNIYDDGRRLSLVATSGAHGTHVAGIVAGYYPKQPELNGIAPGAQIVSVKIGDTRLGSMETGAGLERGAIAAVRNKCDLINMSYGEPTSMPNRGRLTELFSQLVDKHGIVFVASAGNSGPALSTVGAPGGTTSAILGVGAYVSPQMMAAEYTLREKLPEMPYTWTSRGPTQDGDLGVNIFAPGGAIAPVPPWTETRNMQMNGTSMASPNACGAIALLISGLKATGTAYTPYSIRRALENTARTVPETDAFAQGRGLLQVDTAFEHLTSLADATGELLKIDVSLPGRTTSRGVYLRDPHETGQASQYTVRVRPIFAEAATNQEKVDFELRVQLESSQAWVRCGDHVLLNGGGRTFQIEVDPTKLQPGAHYAEVCGYDAENRKRGPLFRLPVTVLVPTNISRDGAAGIKEKFSFKPGEVQRRFIAVPEGATWADLRLRPVDLDGRRQFVIHTAPRQSGRSFKEADRRQYITLQDGVDAVRSFSVTDGSTLEFCLAQNWSSLGATEVECELRFRGLVPNQRQLTILPGDAGVAVEVSSPLGKQRLAPSAALKNHRKTIRPSSAAVRLLGPRDRLPDGRQISQLLLTYQFDLSQAGNVTPRFPQTDGLLYDSPLGSQLWMLFDEGKRRVAADDIWPSAVRLKKGKYTLQLQLRHPDVAKLERMKNLAMHLDRTLSRSVSLKIYPSRTAAVSAGSTLSAKTLQPGQREGLFVAAPTGGLPADATAGDVLLGTIYYGKDDAAQEGTEQRPGGYPIRFVVPPAKASKTVSTATGGGNRVKLEKELLDVRIQQLQRLGEKEATLFDELAGKLLKEHPGHLGVLTAKLNRLDHVKYRKERLPKVVAAADAVLAQIDEDQLAQHFGRKFSSKDSAAAKRDKEMQRQREILIDTLYRKGRALGYMELPDVLEKHPIADPESHDKAFEENFSRLARWVDTTEQKYVLLHIRRERRQGRYGNALALLNKYIPAVPTNYWYFKKRRDVYEKLGWQHWHEYEKTWLLIRFPKQHESF